MQQRIISLILLLTLSLIWGSSFILMKLGMYDSNGGIVFTSNQVAAFRMLLASSIFLPFAFKFRKSIRQKKDVLFLFIVGMCGSFIPAFLFTHAETTINSGLAGMLNSFTPIFTIIIGIVIFKQRLIGREILGILIGLIGVSLLVFFGKNDSHEARYSHILMVILATLCYAISLSIIKYRLNHLHSIAITTISLSFIWPLSFIVILSSDTIDVFHNNSHASSSFFYIFILALFSTTIATLLFNQLIKISSAVFASSVTYIMPIVAVVWGIIYKEKISSVQIICMITILIGVLIINFNIKKKAQNLPN